MLWSLLALLPLVAIYFLKVRPRRKSTTAFFLWQNVLQEKSSYSLFQQLRNFWSLLLMLLAATAVCFAMGRPEWSDDRQDLIILIDRSASMEALEGRSTRLDLARQMATHVIEGLNGSQRASIATVGQNLTFLSHLTDNPRELLDAVARVVPSNDIFNWNALHNLKNHRSQWQHSHRVILISDGNFAAHELPKHIELLRIGTAQENIGLVAADMAYLPSGENRLAFYYQIASSFNREQKIDLTVSHLDPSGSEQLKKVIPLTITPGIQAPEVFTLDDAQPGRWVARLDIHDALESDNLAYLSANQPPPVRVAVDASDRFFLEHSVLAFSQGKNLLTLVTSPAQNIPPSETDSSAQPQIANNPHITLAKGATPDAPLAILFQPEGNSPWWSHLGNEVETGTPRVIAEGHPVLRHLDPATISFVGARQLTPIEGAQVLVADENDLPLIYKATRSGRSVVVVNIDPLAAEFYFSAWFPVLVHSAATHLAGREIPLAASYRPGDAIPIPGASEKSVSQFYRVDPQTSDERPGDNRLPESTSEKSDVQGKWLSAADRIGFYEIKNASGKWAVGVSLLASEETVLTNANAESTNKPLRRGHAPAYLLTVLAIAVLTIESLLYHRRKVG